MPTWDKDLYYRFRQQRTQPSIDLASRIEVECPGRIVDLGCGPGNSTAVLRHRWPESSIIGVDSSAEMLREARESDGQTEWIEADLSCWRPENRFDVVFSNAAIQWVPDHKELIPRLFDLVDDGGVLAVQIPDHYQSPLYDVLLDVSRDSRWTHRMEQARNSLVRNEVSFYYDVLSSLTDSIDLWTTVYYHILASQDDILTFHRGTGMRPYLESLQDDERPAFEKLVLEGYQRAFPSQSDGRVLFPFQRMFFLARR